MDLLRAVIPDLQLNEALLPIDDDSARPASPGMLSKHYSPEAEVLLFAGETETVLKAMHWAVLEHLMANQRVGILALDEEAAYFASLGVQVVTLGPESDLAQVAHNLFAGLRALDAAHVDVLLVRQVGSSGLGPSVNDRLLRAAEGHVIVV